MKSLVALLLAFVACMFGLPAAGAAPPVPTPAPVIAYDTTRELVESAHTVSERGPRAHADGLTAYDAADRWSRGASRRQRDVAASRTYTYNHLVSLAQVAPATSTTQEHAQADGGDLSTPASRGVAAKTGMSAYGVAVSGGKHAGFLKNHLGRSTPEIERGIASIEKQIAGHQAKVQNPAAHIDDWASLDPRQQQALLTSKWPGDIARQREQLDILRGILGSR